jgi:inosine/xanthosine triphosphate pyrophosphatase family protein
MLVQRKWSRIFEGRVYGNLSKERSGKKVSVMTRFYPKNYEISFADMP